MQRYSTIVIGAGPGGIEAARLAARDGSPVALIEAKQAGGTCLCRGCIPTKSLRAQASNGIPFAEAMAAMHQLVDQMSESLRQSMPPTVEWVHGKASLTADGAVEVIQADGEAIRLEADKLVIATGSCPAKLPVPGADTCLTSDDVLRLESLPQSALIIGGGVIGLEFASILNDFGCQVTVVEYCKEVLPGLDSDMAKRLRTYLSRQGISFVTSAAVTAIEPDVKVIYEGKKGQTTLSADVAIMAVGRRPVLPSGLEAAGVTLTPRGYIAVDDRMTTSNPRIQAIGDANGLCMLAHAAEAQARRAAGFDQRLDTIPSAVFTVPEMAAVGLTPDSCAERGIECVIGRALYGSNGKAMAMGATDGIVKVIADAATRRLLGVTVVGEHASDMIAAATLAIQAGMTVDDLAWTTVLAHPTLPELLITACRNVR